jgi:hypothetical protein
VRVGQGGDGVFGITQQRPAVAHRSGLGTQGGAHGHGFGGKAVEIGVLAVDQAFE